MTVQEAPPYPHHQSFWFADTVQLEGQRKASFYNAIYSRMDKKDPQSPFQDQIVHVAVLPEKQIAPDQVEIGMKLVWQIDQKVPVLDQEQRMRIVALGDGEYFLDITYHVTASYGDVHFLSDAVHYAWPYVRMHPQFSVEQGGRITNSEGGINQKGTCSKEARWVDYSNTIDGVAEGLAIFSHSQNEYPHKWLTRDYGTFGPRRPDAQSGKPFTLAKGQSLDRRVGVLVHRGDVKPPMSPSDTSSMWKDDCEPSARRFLPGVEGHFFSTERSKGRGGREIWRVKTHALVETRG